MKIDELLEQLKKAEWINQDAARYVHSKVGKQLIVKFKLGGWMFENDIMSTAQKLKGMIGFPPDLDMDSIYYCYNNKTVSYYIKEKEKGMNKQEIADKVKGILADQLALALSEITDEATIRTDLGVDSLDEVEMVIAIEECFEIEIDEEEVLSKYKENVTVADIVEWLDKRLNS